MVHEAVLFTHNVKDFKRVGALVDVRTPGG
jgi:hypothetical protein